MAQNMENIDFRTFFTVTSQQWSLLKQKYDFWVPWNISDQIHRIFYPKLLYFFEKMHKVFKIKAQGCSTPLSGFMCIIERETQNFIIKFSEIFIWRETVLRAHGMKSDDKSLFYQILCNCSMKMLNDVIDNS